MFERSRKGDHALLIQPHGAGPVDDSLLQEFSELAKSAGATIAATLDARVIKRQAATYFGSGKVEEAKAMCEATQADLVLVNVSLSPIQQRNLEKVLERRVIDRSGLILDIFALRANTHEGKLQVELAQLRYMATRLVRGWTHLERQRGGSIGLRGPGETQLEMDRRIIQTKVESLERRLDKVEKQRQQMRRARLRNELPRISLVGYTNAGKSTLFNAMTDANAYAADKLFATLDPTVRRLEGLPCGPVLLSDTVGFVRDLAHELVAAFRSTLSEVKDADLLIHLVDASDPLRQERIQQVNEVLEEIGAGDIPQILVFNKIDRLENFPPRIDQNDGAKTRVWLSAQNDIGLDLLKDAVSACFNSQRLSGELRLSGADGRLRARLHELDAIVSESCDEQGWAIQIDMPKNTAKRLATESGGHPLEQLLLVGEAEPFYNSN